MYVCICNAVTDKQIRAAAESGVRDLYQLQNTLGVATLCGSCKDQATAILGRYRSPDAMASPAMYHPTLAGA